MTEDSRIIVTLDAGGTNLVFGALRDARPVGAAVAYPSNSDNLDLCLATIKRGFREVISSLPEAPAAISFAFPGPADYEHGIIGGYLPNFPSFRDGVPLGPILSREFGVPVFINNDGDLFAFGEAKYGALPLLNRRLAEAGSVKRFRNLIGYTLGTGFGIGMVIDGRLNRGDNSCVETFCLPHGSRPGIMVEEGVAVRAVTRVYGELSGDTAHGLTPKEICEIADGVRPGNSEAALGAFAELGKTAGGAMAIAAQLIDGIIVIGGGITGARRHFMPALLAEMRSGLATLRGESVRRVQMDVCDLSDESAFADFARGSMRMLPIPGTDEMVPYDDSKRIGVMFSTLGASNAIQAGAYAYAISRLDAEEA